MTVFSAIVRRNLRTAPKAALLALFALFAASPSAHAAVLLWDKFGSGNFNDPNNWFGGGPPGPNDFVKFELGWGHPYTVTFPGHDLVAIPGGSKGSGSGVAQYASSHLRVRDNGVTFVGSTQPFKGPSVYAITSNSMDEDDRAIIIGEWGGENASHTLAHPGFTGGGLTTFVGAAATLGDEAGAAGTLNVATGAFNVTGSQDDKTQLIVGNRGAGALNVTGGADVNVTGFNSRTALANNAGASGSVNISGVGSKWTSANALWIGVRDLGSLTVQNGGSLVTSATGGTASAILGVFAGGRGSVTVTGAGSTWTNSARLNIGNSGNGELNITNGGRLVNTNGAFSDIGGNAFGIATVTGAGSQWNTPGTIQVGSTGQGALHILNGGSVSAGAVTIRALNSGFGEVFMNGAGSTLNVNVGPLTIGMPEPGFVTGTTSLAIGPGARVNVAHDIDLDTNGRLKLQGGTLAAALIGSRDLLSGQIEGKFEWTSGTLHAGYVLSTSVVNQAGKLAPGLPLGRTTIDGNYTQNALASMEIEIGGATAGTLHDFVYLEGMGILDGALDLALVNGFIPAPAQTFTILDSLGGTVGAFANVANGQRLTTVDGLGSFQVNYGASSAFDYHQIVLSNFESAIGDFDSDGDADSADFAIWKKGFGNNSSPDEFGNGYDGGNFLDWQRKFGGGSPPPQAPPAMSAVPEPSSLLIAVLSAIGLSAAARRS